MRPDPEFGLATQAGGDMLVYTPWISGSGKTGHGRRARAEELLGIR